MNLRLISLITVVVVFAVACGAMSFLSGGGITLEQAYDSKQVEITQKTIAGTIPHNIVLNTVKSFIGTGVKSFIGRPGVGI